MGMTRTTAAKVYSGLRAFSVGMLALLAPPLAAQPALQSPREASSAVATGATAKPVRARPALWVVKDNHTTIYLLGTIHLMKPQVAWFEGRLREAYDQADEVTLEVVDDMDVSAGAMLRKAANPDGQLTSLLLPKAIRPRLTAMAQEQRLPMNFLDRMKPWFVAVTLSMAPYQRLGYDPKQGVDAVLKARANADGKKLVGLETAEEQIGFLDGLHQQDQIDMLVSTIEESDKAAETLNAMVGAWSKGETEKLAEEMNKSLDESPRIAKSLLFDRNARWAEWIKTRMERPGVVLLAVGAGHLAGRESLQDKLAAIGLKARRLSNR